MSDLSKTVIFLSKRISKTEKEIGELTKMFGALLTAEELAKRGKLKAYKEMIEYAKTHNL